jgi:hypothetical protein
VDAVVGVGGLFGVDVEAEDGALADGAAAFEAGVEDEADDVAGSAKHGKEIGADSFFDAATLERAEEVADGGGAGVFWFKDDYVGHDGVEVVVGTELG